MHIFPKLSINQNAPDFHLISTNDHVISVGQFKQRKNVVLYFFEDAKCHPCKQKLTEFKDNFNRLEHLNAVLFGISHDTINNLKALQQELQLPFQLLSDVNLTATNAYYGLKLDKSGIIPAIFVLDRYNSLYSQWLVEDESKLPPVLEILRNLHAIEIECPECGFFPGSTSI